MSGRRSWKLNASFFLGRHVRYFITQVHTRGIVFMYDNDMQFM